MEATEGYHLPAVEVFTDYSQWERRPSQKSGASWSSTSRGKTRSKQQAKLVSKKLSREGTLSCAAKLSQDSVMVVGPPTFPTLPRLHTHCNSRRDHIAQPRPILFAPNSSPKKKSFKAQSSTFFPILPLNELQFGFRRKSIEELKKYKDDLLAANLRLIGDIRKYEDEKNSLVQELLDKYRKSRGSVAALKKKTHRDTMELRAELDETKQWIAQKEQELHEEMREVDLLLQAKTKERDILKSFKEKNFMVNQVTIEQLKDEIKSHEHFSKDVIETVEAEMDEERAKCQEMMDTTRREIEAKATEECIDVMKKSVKEKGIQNRIMEKELVLLHSKAEVMRQSIEDLRNDIDQLKVLIDEDRVKSRPLFLLEKCLPDTELKLNIPILDS